MRLTSAEAEWAMRAVVVDRLGEGAGAIVIEAAPARRGDPPNIQRLRVGGPGEAMAELERGLEPIASGTTPPIGIIARMSLAVLARVASCRALAEHAAKPRRRAQ